MSNIILIIICTLIITIVIGYFLGLTIVTLIDKRLNNLPFENFENKNVDVHDVNYINKETIVSKKNFKYDNEYYKNMNKNVIIDGYNKYSEKHCGWNVEKKNTQICCKNHIHQKNGNDKECTYGVTNYADPKDMSSFDYKIFNLNYPPNLTLQDYINWLYCFLDKEDQLPYNHLKNLEKLKSGKILIEEEGILPPPSYYYPSLNAENYFDKMYNNINEFNIASPLNNDTGPMIGYNYDEYSEFSQNADLYGSGGAIRNKDISKKKNAKKLREFVQPQDSHFINKTDENDIYRIKNVEV